jgi:hypothetical protein
MDVEDPHLSMGVLLQHEGLVQLDYRMPHRQGALVP